VMVNVEHFTMLKKKEIAIILVTFDTAIEIRRQYSHRTNNPDSVTDSSNQTYLQKRNGNVESVFVQRVPDLKIDK